MPGGLGPRFALEAGFLILLAAVAAYARLSTAEIIAVMAGGWLLTAIFEVIAATRERLYLRTRWQPRVEEKPAVAEAEPEAEPKLRRSRFRRAPATETETKAEAVAPPESEAQPEAEPEPPPEAEPEAPPPAPPATEDVAPAAEAPAPAPASTDEDTGEFELPAPEPRRWFRRKRAEPPPLTEADVEPARPSARHVRLIRGNTPDATEGETHPSEAADQERKDADSAS
jgi:hypothetical protein